MNNTTKRNITLALVALVAAYMFFPSKKEGFTVYGTTWCGYTTKQRDHLNKKYGRNSHAFIDCDKPGNKGKCGGMDGFPVTITKEGKRVEGFDTSI